MSDITNEDYLGDTDYRCICCGSKAMYKEEKDDVISFYCHRHFEELMEESKEV